MPEVDTAVAEPETGGDLGTETIDTGTPDTGVDEGLGETVEGIDPLAPEVEEEKPEEVQQPEPSDPELAGLDPKYHKDKTVRGMFHALRALRAQFPGGINEAIKLKEAVETQGGLQAIAGFEKERAEFAQVDKDFSEGNPRLIDEWVKDNPQGLAKLAPLAFRKLADLDPFTFAQEVPASLNLLAEKDAAQYNGIAGRIFWNTATLPNGLNEHLKELDWALKHQDIEGASTAMAAAGQFMQAIKKFADQAPPERPKQDPREAEFQAKQQKWEADRAAEKLASETQKKEQFATSIRDANRDYTVEKITAQLGKEYSSRNLSLNKLKESDPESYQMILENCFKAVGSELDKDTAGRERFNAAIQAGKRDTAIQITKGRVDAVFAKAVSETYKRFHKIVGGKSVQTAPAAQPNPLAAKPQNGIMPLSRNPPPEMIDKPGMYAKYGKEKADSMIWKGQIMLRDKKGLYQTPD